MNHHPQRLYARSFFVLLLYGGASATVGGCDTANARDSGLSGGTAGANPTVNGAGGGGVDTSVSGAAGGSSSSSIGGSADPSTLSGSGGVAGSGGNAGATGVSGDGGRGAVDGTGLPEVSSEGDGDRTIGPNYVDDPSIFRAGTAPDGSEFTFEMPSADSAIYPGINGPFTRRVTVHVPAQYVPGRPAPLMVAQDAGAGFQGELTTTVNNLSATKELPPLILIFVGNGGGDRQGSERGLEYDTVSGLYAEFIQKEVLPRTISEAQHQLQLTLALTSDPNGRGAFGASSGGSVAFSMAWWHPDLFRRVLSYSGSFISQVSEPTPFPHGCWVYHDVDPHFVQLTEPPHGLIVEHCWSPGASVGNPGPCDTPLTQGACEAVAGCAWNVHQNKPLRAWIEAGTHDIGSPGVDEQTTAYGAPEYRNWDNANQRMAAALAARGYHYHYDRALNADHSDGRAVRQTLPDAMRWVWRGYPTD